MDIFNKMIPIRMVNKSTTNQKVFSIVIAMITGIIMGLAAKLVDDPNINPIFDDIGGRLGIWVFAATILSVYSYSPKLAAVKVFAFFASMLTIYYVYTTFVLHFFPERAIIFWGICAVLSPICAYIMWYARGRGWFSNFTSALPITILLSEGFKLRDAYLPIHHHYYLVPWLMGVYLILIVVLLLIIPKNKMQIWVILPTAIILSLIMLNFNILGRIFAGMNGVL